MLATLALALAPLQAVHVVDADLNGDFQYLWNAVDIAQDGDTILIRPPADPNHVFTGATIRGKSLTIEPEPGYSPRVLTQNPALWQPVLIQRINVEDLEVGQTVTLRSLAMVRDGSAGPEHYGVDVVHCAGAIRIEDCYLSDTDYYSFGVSPTNPLGVLWLDHAADVSVTRSTIRSKYQHGVRMVNSRLVAYESQIGGGSPRPVHAAPYSEGETGHAGILCEGRSFLWLGGCDVTGGTGGYSACAAYVACTGVGGKGGVALSVGPSSRAFVLDTRLEPGEGGFWCEETNPHLPGSGCHQVVYGPSGDPSEGAFVDVPGGQRSLEAPDSWIAGADLPVTVYGTPGERVLVTVGTGAGLRFFGPLFGALLVNSGALLTSHDLGVIPGSGVLEADLSIPSPPLGESATIHVQASLRTSPTRWRLTTPTSVLLL